MVQMSLRLPRPLGGGSVGSAAAQADLRLSEQICGGPRPSAAVQSGPTAAQAAPS